LLQAADKPGATIQKVQLPRDRSSSDMDTAMEDAAGKAVDSVAVSRDSDSDSPRRDAVPNLQVEAFRNILGADAEKQVRQAYKCICMLWTTIAA
jgi:hypothetical protein